ncbi:hypothetical protein B0H11DRAFT_2401908 [Mycena galericulata]|nr:hypothetical protein B0H11DRAFT_2401908 [Mycena galericulata]
MPVTFSVAAHEANKVKMNSRAQEGFAGDWFLFEACRNQARDLTFPAVLQFGIVGTEGSGDLTAKFPRLVPHDNGLFKTVISAYNEHHALVIRPDDVWLAILSQFNFFVNANAELLRASFVVHEGKRELKVTTQGKFDFGALSRQMADLIQKNVVDPELRAWAIPAFTTTTEGDITSAAVLLMATTRPYFHHGFSKTACGIPRVTLAGERADWADILGRLEKLKEYGVEATAWYHLLQPVLVRFVATFDAPESAENMDFWSKIVHYHRKSGGNYYTGWINAFSVFNKYGVWLGHKLDKDAVSAEAPETISAETFWKTYATGNVHRDLVFDGSPFHRLDKQKVPPCYAEVDVTVEEYGDEWDGVMVAGLVGMRVSSSKDIALSADGEDDTVSPVAGWWMLMKKADAMDA